MRASVIRLMRAAAICLVMLLVVGLGACTRTVPTHTETLRETVLRPAPAVISVPELTYVPIDAELTKRCSWVRNGDLQDVLEVSRGRKRCLDVYEANLDEIAAKQGTPAPADIDAKAKP